MEYTIPLVKALSGFTMTIKHLDGRILWIKETEDKNGKIIKPGTIKMIPNEGMKSRYGDKKGNLYIKFNVEFPDAPFLKPEMLQALSANINQPTLSPGIEYEKPPGAVEAYLTNTTKQNFEEERSHGQTRHRQRREEQFEQPQCTQM